MNRCWPRAFALPSALPTELASINDLHQVREATEFAWAEDAANYFLPSGAPGAGARYRRGPNDSRHRFSTLDPQDVGTTYETDLRVRDDGLAALMTVSSPPSSTPAATQYLYDLSPNISNHVPTPLRCLDGELVTTE